MLYQYQCSVCRKKTRNKSCHSYQKPNNYSDCTDLYLCEGCLSSPFMKAYNDNFIEAERLTEEIYEEFTSRSQDIFDDWVNDRANLLFNKYRDEE